MEAEDSDEVVDRPPGALDVKKLGALPPIFSTSTSSFPMRLRSSSSLDLWFLLPCRPLALTRVRFGNTQSMLDRLQAAHG